jgi:hydroxymethylglutaryl-CoA synthase
MVKQRIGIEAISFYTPKVYLDLADLAVARQIDVNKYKIGIGQEKMSLIEPFEDIVTMAAEASFEIIKPYIHDIDLLLFATESGVDFSKAAGIYLHQLLGLQPQCRVLEIKQACYAATGALQLAKDYVATHPNKKALVVSSDVAWYGFNTPGEVTQGAGAIAMIVSSNPKIAFIEEGSFSVTNIEDFYRPSYYETPIVDGKLSIRSYKELLEKVAPEKALDYVCFHMPFATMSNKANESLSYPITESSLTLAKLWNKEVGNIYNGSLYLSLLSLLHSDQVNLNQQTIGMFSYGSGAMAEFFYLHIVDGYQKQLNNTKQESIIHDRLSVGMSRYKELMTIYSMKEKSLNFLPENTSTNHRFILKEIKNGHRYYQINDLLK